MDNVATLEFDLHGGSIATIANKIRAEVRRNSGAVLVRVGDVCFLAKPTDDVGTIARKYSEANDQKPAKRAGKTR